MSDVTVTFPRLNQFWNDSGVLGLYRCIKGSVHADPQPEDADWAIPLDSLVEVSLEPHVLQIGGEANHVEKVLCEAYERLVARYYNLSTQKQREDRRSYNFYYDSQQDEFKLFPKRNATGIAALTGKALRPARSQVKWDGKPGSLPPSHAYLQTRLDQFLQHNEIKAGPDAGMLVDGPNRVRPNMRVCVREGGRKERICFLCGHISSATEKINQTVFPFITGDSGVLSFFSTTRGACDVCWRCAFIGKFVPANGFYVQAGDRLHMFFPVAPSLTKLNAVYERLLRRMTVWEPNFWRNFELPLGGYFSHPSETAFAFLYAVYLELTGEQRLQEDEKDGYNDEDGFQEKVFDFALRDAPVSFALVSTEQKGQTQLPTRMWIFDDLSYLFRLFRALEKQGTAWRDLAYSMLDSTAARDENRSLERDRMLGALLRKQSILRRAESFAFHVNRGQRQDIGPLAHLVSFYEPILRKGGSMDQEALNAAVALGKRIGAAVSAEKGKKGSLFTLRKCRTLSNFLNELSRLQLRYRVAVPPATYEGHLSQENFEEFRGFCMLAALNTFNAGATRGQAEATPEGRQGGEE